MNNDLISRSALMQSLRGNVLVDVTPNLEQAIEEHPTAYDMDKVLEELKGAAEYAEAKFQECYRLGSWATQARIYRRAIEIVKSGRIK